MDSFEVGDEVIVRLPGFTHAVARGVITSVNKEVDMVFVKTGPYHDDWLVANFGQIEKVRQR